MLRVGLTGGLGSGKSTVAAMLRERGAEILSADEMARSLMQPGQAVYDAIVERFGTGIARADGTLDRPALARVAFGEGRIDELNAIVHPATIQLQARMLEAIANRDRAAIVVIESALIFESKYGFNWRERFDKLILVTAPEPLKIARFIQRSGGVDPGALEAEARRRLAQMIPDEIKAPQCDFVIPNDGTLADLMRHINHLWAALTQPPESVIPVQPESP